MNTQFRWFKFDALTFLLDPAVMVLSLAEQGALVRLMAHASRQQPFASIPANPAQQAAMVGMSPARWGKMASRVLSLWVQDGDRWLCPMMLDLLTVQQSTEQQSTESAASESLSSKRSAAAKARWNNAKRDSHDANPHANTMQNDANGDAKPVLHDANAMQNDANPNFACANEGGKGGDLDLEQELDQEVKKRSSSSAGGQASAGANLPEFTSKPVATDAQSLADAFPNRPASPPAEWLALAKADYPQADHSGEWVKFRNHFWPLTGDRRTMAKWQSAWLGWVGRAAPTKAVVKPASAKPQPNHNVNAPFQAEIDAIGHRDATPEELADWLREMGEPA